MFLNELKSKNLLKQYGISVSEVHVVNSGKEAIITAKKIGFPVVLKVVSERIIHKSDVGGVILNIEDEKSLIKAYEDMLSRLKGIDPEARISLQKQLPKSVELIAGIQTDPSFGSIILFGLGGIFTEILNDVSIRLVPITEEDAYEMIDELKGKRILEGYRGYPSVDREALVAFLVKISAIAEKEDIKEMDLNPVFARGNSITVVDARVRL